MISSLLIINMQKKTNIQFSKHAKGLTHRMLKKLRFGLRGKSEFCPLPTLY